MSTPRLGPSTIAIHGGKPHRGADWTPAVTPIYQSATFRNPLGSDAEVRAISRGDSHVLAFKGAFVVPLAAPLEVGGPADLAVLAGDPRPGGAGGEPIAVFRGGRRT